MKLIKKYFNIKPNPKDILKYFEMNYHEARDTQSNADEHQYLANTLLLILEEKKNLDTAERELGLWDKETMWNSLALNETMLFSVLNYPESIRALSLYAVYKRVPTQSYKYGKEYDKIMAPVIEMYENATFIDVYKNMNPIVTKGKSKKEFILPNIEEINQRRFELVHLVRLEATNMFYKQLGEYLDKETFEYKMESLGYKTARNDLSLFTRTNINNKIRCFCSEFNRIKKTLERYPDDAHVRDMVKKAKFEDYLLPMQQIEALKIKVVSGHDAMAEFVAREITLNADLLY